MPTSPHVDEDNREIPVLRSTMMFSSRFKSMRTNMLRPTHAIREYCIVIVTRSFNARKSRRVQYLNSEDCIDSSIKF